MKTLFKSLFVLLLALMAGGFQSCEIQAPKQEATGTFELYLNLEEQVLAELKSETVPDSVGVSTYHALLTVFGRDSVPVLEDELIPLYKFGDGFFSEKVELKVGAYRLLKFMIVNPEGEVIFASPMAGSPKAYLVKDPLPIGFKIQPEETTRLRPEVLPVAGEPPSEFGYTSFGFSVVKPLPFHIGVMIDNPMIMEATSISAVAPAIFTEAILSVYHPDGWHHDFPLEAKVNRVVIRGGAEYYTFVIEKRGYEAVKFEIHAKKLLQSTPDNPIIIRLGSGPNVLVLQPDPDHGFDAMISDRGPEENFGKHPYFEATWRSDSLLAVMYENRSLIQFSPTGLPKSAKIEKVILTLFYDIPIPWDYIRMDSVKTPVKDSLNPDIAYGAVLQQIVEPWQEHEVTWKNQPKTIIANQVFVRPFIKNANFIDIDVTGFWVPVEEIAAPNYGMMFKLVSKDFFPGFRFASSDFKEPRMRPLLRIYYSLPTG